MSRRLGPARPTINRPPRRRPDPAEPLDLPAAQDQATGGYGFETYGEHDLELEQLADRIHDHAPAGSSRDDAERLARARMRRGLL